MEGALTRDPEDKGRYVLEGVGSLTVGSWRSRSATLRAENGRTWEIGHAGWRQRVVIADAAGGEPARYERAGTFKRGGRIIAGVEEFAWRPVASWGVRYALLRDDRELAVLEAGGWDHKRPVRVRVAAPVDPLVLLTACWLAKGVGDNPEGTPR